MLVCGLTCVCRWSNRAIAHRNAIQWIGTRHCRRAPAVAVEVGPRGDEHARRRVQEVALYGGRRRVAVLDVDLQPAQERGDLPVEAADHPVHHLRHGLVGAPLLHRRIQVDADAPLLRDGLRGGVGVEGLAGAALQVLELDLTVAARDRHVVQLVPERVPRKAYGSQPDT